MSSLALSALFEYLFMGLRPVEIFYSFSAGVEFRRQNLTSKFGSRTERVKPK